MTSTGGVAPPPRYSSILHFPPVDLGGIYDFLIQKSTSQTHRLEKNRLQIRLWIKWWSKFETSLKKRNNVEKVMKQIEWIVSKYTQIRSILHRSRKFSLKPTTRGVNAVLCIPWNPPWRSKIVEITLHCGVLFISTAAVVHRGGQPLASNIRKNHFNYR